MENIGSANLNFVSASNPGIGTNAQILIIICL